MNVETGTVAALFLSWEYLFPIFSIGSLCHFFKTRSYFRLFHICASDTYCTIIKCSDMCNKKIPTPHGLINYKHQLNVNGLCSRCWSVWGPPHDPTLPQPLTHCIRVYCTFIHTGTGGRRDELERRLQGQKLGRKYQHDWLYLQSINSKLW